MKLYHCTRKRIARHILRNGFREATGTYLTRHEYSGVWFCSRPLGWPDGQAFGEVVLSVEIPVSVIRKYEWIEDGKPYREWLIPAKLANQFPVVVDSEETGSDRRIGGRTKGEVSD